MRTLPTTKPARHKSRSGQGKLAAIEIQRRLEQIELATVSSLRALQMDINGDDGVPSSLVLKRARAAVR